MATYAMHEHACIGSFEMREHVMVGGSSVVVVMILIKA